MKKIISAIVLLVILCTLSSCGTAEAAVTEPIEPAEIKTVAPPENGWTIEELANTIYFNGQSIKLPLKIKDLGDKYDVNKDDIYFLGTSATVPLTYDNEIIAVLTLENCLKLDDVYDSNVSVIILSSLVVDENSNECVMINGLSLSGNKNDAISCLGEPTKTDVAGNSGVLIYNIKETEDCLMTVHYNEKDELTNIYVHIK